MDITVQVTNVAKNYAAHLCSEEYADNPIEVLKHVDLMDACTAIKKAVGWYLNVPSPQEWVKAAKLFVERICDEVYERVPDSELYSDEMDKMQSNLCDRFLAIIALSQYETAKDRIN